MSKQKTKRSPVQHSKKGQFRMPMVSEAEVGGVPNQETDAFDRSPLGVYVKTAGITLTAFSRAIGVQYKTCQEWAAGSVLPTLPAAYEIERVTKGVVPMEAWLSLPKAKSMLAEWRVNQPEAMKKNPTLINGGGFAHPLPKHGVKARKEIEYEEEDQLERERELPEEEP